MVILICRQNGGIVVAGGAGASVSLVSTGVSPVSIAESEIYLEMGSVIASGAAVLNSAGGIQGMDDEFSGDIVADSVSLTANQSDIFGVSVETDNFTATTLSAVDIDVTQINLRPIFIGGGLNPTILSSGGNISFDSRRNDDATVEGNDIIVLEAPTYDTVGGTLAWDTPADVVYAITSSSSTASGNLSEAMDNVTNASNENIDGGTRAAFSSTIRSALRLTETIDVTSKIELDGRQRINTLTGGYTIGNPVDIDGSRLAASDKYGIHFQAGSDESTVSGLAFYNFSDTGGAAIKVSGLAEDVTISNNFIGLRSTGRAARNRNGIIVEDALTLTIEGNTIARSTEAGS